MRLHPPRRLPRRARALLAATALAIASLALALSATTATAETPAWQARLNAIRSMSLLEPVTANSTWSSGCWYHSRYCTENGYLTHSESTSNRWYTTRGASAAPRSNLAMAGPSGALGTGTRAIDMWAVGPFHALGMLNPKLQSVGWGLYRRSGKYDTAALNVKSGVVSTVPVTWPVKWPGPGSTTPFLRYSGGESPNPISGTGYSLPTGPPIIVQFSGTPSVTAYGMKTGSTFLSCKLVAPTNYRNSNAASQQTGRAILAQSRAVYIVPRKPLASGKTYVVSVVNRGVRYTWSFNTGSAPAPATSR
jgi:hypothetical protein